MKYVLGALAGFVASAILNRPTHIDGFPETGRYAVGLILVALVMALCDVPKEEIERFLAIGGAVGFGVVMARIFTR